MDGIVELGHHATNEALLAFSVRHVFHCLFVLVALKLMAAMASAAKILSMTPSIVDTKCWKHQ